MKKLKILIRARRRAYRHAQGYNDYRYVPIFSGYFPNFRVPKMSNFAKWLNDVYGPGHYSILANNQKTGRWYCLFLGWVREYDYEVKKGNIKRVLDRQMKEVLADSIYC